MRLNDEYGNVFAKGNNIVLTSRNFQFFLLCERKEVYLTPAILEIKKSKTNIQFVFGPKPGWFGLMGGLQTYEAYRIRVNTQKAMNRDDS